MATDKQNIRHTISPQTHIVFILPRPKGIGSCHKSGTGNNKGRQRTSPCYERCFNRNDCHSKRMSCHYRWYMFLLNWIIQSSIHISCPRFVNSHPVLRRTLLVINGALIARTVNQRVMSFHHRWYLCLLHLMIHSIIQLSCPRFVNNNPDLHITQLISWFTVLAIKAPVITRSVLRRTGWLLTNRGQLIWIDDWIIQLRRNIYHR